MLTIYGLYVILNLCYGEMLDKIILLCPSIFKEHIRKLYMKGYKLSVVKTLHYGTIKDRKKIQE